MGMDGIVVGGADGILGGAGGESTLDIEITC